MNASTWVGRKGLQENWLHFSFLIAMEIVVTNSFTKGHIILEVFKPSPTGQDAFTRSFIAIRWVVF
ncbi:hypothetical protein [Cyclobacterium jeungdonense]|uniref:Uncharacterized protein n=1 Tax=Cyclobacterium jeungdonense TaxID=708087 RepID=A0ABT8C3I7_9BACT|nr:hypothetical protein [Cyclobacterium jeungdonense]MDN3687266.1 hypothetical protein [Cyclobacterium jeungdonense]